MPDAPRAPRPPKADIRLMTLFVMLGFSAGLPFYLFSTVLFLRLARVGVDIAVIGFFGWVSLLPTFKFLWAPLLDRFSAPGFAPFWGRRRSWILLSQLGIVASIVGLAFVHPERSLAQTAFWAVLLAFWTTTLEVAADAWRVELAPDAASQGRLSAANLWGYRTAMVAAGSGALIVADRSGWTAAYLVIAVAAFAAFPLLVSTRPEPGASGRRWRALAHGILAAAPLLAAFALLTGLVGSVLLSAVEGAGLSAHSNVTTPVLIVAMLPFLLMALAIPRVRAMGPEAPLRRSAALGPYIDIFWRYGFMTLAVMLFVSLYRMGDVLALNMSKPLVNSVGYSLTQIGVADSWVALGSSIVGVALGGWMAAHRSGARALAAGAVLAAIGNFGFIWLAHQPPSTAVLYLSTALDQFGNGFAGTVFVVYLSLLVNPAYAGSQYAFLSGFAFLLPRLVAGAAGAMQKVIGYDGVFLLSGLLSLAAILLLPLIARTRPRRADDSPGASPKACEEVAPDAGEPPLAPALATEAAS